MIKEKKGVTMIALTITILVLIIISSISIGVLGGENGIIKRAKIAKKETEIAEEKETLQRATAQAVGKDVYGNIEESRLQNELDEETGKGKTEVIDAGEEIEVVFKDSKRYYSIDEKGNIGDAQEIIEDENPGDITKDEDGNDLDGSEEKPYEIWCIEDLVEFSKAINNNEINRSCKVLLMRTLNFKSKLSYINYESKYSYDETKLAYIKDDTSSKNIMELCTKDLGFIPIKTFSGTFEGNRYEIKNIYINTEENAGLFGETGRATIKNVGITGEITSTKNSAGGINGDGFGSNFYNCYNKAKIYGEKMAGGIVGAGGWTSSIMENCYNEGEIISKSYAGGIAGIYAGIINKCTNYANITTEGYAGGIIGESAGKIKISNCTNFGNVESKAWPSGGILGLTYAESEILNCSNIGDVKVRKNTSNICLCMWNSRK